MENSYNNNNNNNNINNTGSNKKYVKDKLKKLSRYAKERGMVKDYGDNVYDAYKIFITS